VGGTLIERLGFLGRSLWEPESVGVQPSPQMRHKGLGLIGNWIGHPSDFDSAIDAVFGRVGSHDFRFDSVGAKGDVLLNLSGINAGDASRTLSL
jgi:hypothetical protein